MTTDIPAPSVSASIQPGLIVFLSAEEAVVCELMFVCCHETEGLMHTEEDRALYVSTVVTCNNSSH